MMAEITDADKRILKCDPYYDSLIENSIGTMEIPIGLAVGKVGKTVYNIPLAGCNPGIVTAVTNGFAAAKTIRMNAVNYGRECQIYLINTSDKFFNLKTKLLAEKINQIIPKTITLKSINIGPVSTYHEQHMGKIIMRFDTGDSFKFDELAEVCDEISTMAAKLSDGKVFASGISSSSPMVAHAVAKFDIDDELIKKILLLELVDSRLANLHRDSYDAMNAFTTAVGQSTTCIEPQVDGCINSQWSAHDGLLIGEIWTKLDIGINDGNANLSPVARVSKKLLGNPDLKEIASLTAAIGIATQFNAFKTLVTSD